MRAPDWRQLVPSFPSGDRSRECGKAKCADTFAAGTQERVGPRHQCCRTIIQRPFSRCGAACAMGRRRPPLGTGGFRPAFRVSSLVGGPDDPSEAEGGSRGEDDEAQREDGSHVPRDSHGRSIAVRATARPPLQGAWRHGSGSPPCRSRADPPPARPVSP